MRGENFLWLLTWKKNYVISLPKLRADKGRGRNWVQRLRDLGNSTPKIWDCIWNVSWLCSNKCCLKQSWGMGYRGLVNSLLSNTTPPDFFFIFFWGVGVLNFSFQSQLMLTSMTLSDFTQLPLETLKALRNFCHIAVVMPRSSWLWNDAVETQTRCEKGTISFWFLWFNRSWSCLGWKELNVLPMWT